MRLPAPAPEQNVAPRRILMTADAVGGVWTYAVELCDALALHGVKTLLAVMGPAPSERQRNEIAIRPYIQLAVREFRLEWMQEPWDDVQRAGDWLLQLERAYEPEIVHLNGYAHAALPWRAPTVVVGHSCVWSWHRSVEKREPGPEWQAYREAVAGGLAAASVVTAPSTAMLHSLHVHYGAFRGQEAIANGRHPELFAPREKKPYVLTAGRLWDKAKNVSLLASVSDALPWPVYVAGEAAHPDGGGQWQGDNLIALGQLPPRALGRWMGHASIFALPARYEPFGYTALEAGLAGCALILGDIPSLREVWGDAALYVNPDDGPALLRTAEQLCRDDRLRRERGRLARERARDFTPERMARHYLHTYRHALAPAERSDRTLRLPQQDFAAVPPTPHPETTSSRPQRALL